MLLLDMIKKHTAKYIGEDGDGSIWHYRGFEITSFKSQYGKGWDWSYGQIGQDKYDAQNTLKEAKLHIDQMLDSGIELINEDTI